MFVLVLSYVCCEFEDSVEVDCDHHFNLYRHMCQFSVDADPIQRDFANCIEKVLSVSQLFLQVSFLWDQIWLDSYVPVLEGVLISAGQAEKSVSISFSFQLQEDRGRICWAVYLFKIFLYRELLDHFYRYYLTSLSKDTWRKLVTISFCDFLMMICCCYFQKRRFSSVSSRGSLFLLQLVLSSLRFVLLLSGSACFWKILIVDKIARSVYVMLSCHYLFIFTCFPASSSPIAPCHFWFARLCCSLEFRIEQYLSMILFFLTSNVFSPFCLRLLLFLRSVVVIDQW